MELKFRNSSVSNLFAAVFCSSAAVILCIIGIIGGSIAGEAKYNILALEIFGSILLCIWIIYFVFTFIFCKTVVVSEEEIALKRKNKILWTIKKDTISECVYEKLSFRNFFSPNAAVMLFKLKGLNKFAERKISKHFSTAYCISLSYKKVKKMIEIGYPVRVTDTIYKQ